MRDLKNNLTSSKNSRNIQSKRTKSFGYQVLGFGSGGAALTFIEASGGTVLTVGDYKTHVFTGPGTFTVCAVGTAGVNDAVDYFVVAGGGGGAVDGYSPEPRGRGGGAGGAGGFRLSNAAGCLPAPTMSPLANATGLTVSATGYPIAVGGGGAAGPSNPTNDGGKGVTSTFSSIDSAGGGAGPGANSTGGGGGSPPGCYAGGSGSGLGADPNNGTTPVFDPGSNLHQGNQPPVSPIQGNPGGGGLVACPGIASGGGGGAGTRGTDPPSANVGGAGGVGSFLSDTFFGPTAPSYGTAGPESSTRYFAGGGGGKASPGTPGAGGSGGGGAGTGVAGTTNTGGGGGGRRLGTAGGGGPGIVVLRYKFQ